MPVSLTRVNLQRACLCAAIAVLCAMTGWALVQHSKYAMLPVAILGLLAVMVVFAELGLKALWLWPVLGVAAAPLSQHLGSRYISFDRVWVIGMVVLLLILPPGRARARASRWMLLALALLTIVLGIRSCATPAATLYPIRIWFDSLVIPLILFAVVRRVVSLDGRLAEKVAFSLMVAGLLLALIGIAEHFTGFELATAYADGVPRQDVIGVVRISGPYGVPETYGLALISCLGATMYWLLGWRRTGWIRSIAIGIAALEVLAIVFTYFRVGWISALLVMLAALGLRPHRYGRVIATVALASLIAVPVYVQLDKSSLFTERVNNTNNIYTRLAIYEQGWEIFKSAPVFGVGAQQYNAVASQLPITYVNGAPSFPYPHSSLFEVMAEYGIAGLIPLLVAFAAVWGLVHALNRAARAGPDVVLAGVLVAMALSYLIYSLTLEMLPYSPSNELFAIVLAIAAGRLDYLASNQSTAMPSCESARLELPRSHRGRDRPLLTDAARRAADGQRRVAHKPPSTQSRAPPRRD